MAWSAHKAPPRAFVLPLSLSSPPVTIQPYHIIMASPKKKTTAAAKKAPKAKTPKVKAAAPAGNQ